MSKIRLKQKSLFWLLQLFGWGVLGGSQIAIKSTFAGDELSIKYVIAEGLIIIIFGVLFSCLMRLVFLKKINLGDFTFVSLFWVLGVVLITSVVVTTLEYVIAGSLYFYLHNKEMVFSAWGNVINNFIMFSLWSILYFAIKALMNSQKEKVERLQLESNLKESQLNTLKGQINPHFMFNSLNNIRGLMLEDVSKSREMITKLSELLRYSLNSNKIDRISITEELETVRNYIELSKIQLEERLQYREEIGEGVVDMKIPPMLIQMLIENAIKHGISNQLKGGEVILKLYTETSNLYIEVVNNGRLENNNSSTRIGLANIRERLRLLYGSSATFNLKEKEGKVVASIKMPLENGQDKQLLNYNY